MSNTRSKQEEKLQICKEQLLFFKVIADETCRPIPTVTGKILGTGNDSDMVHNATFWGAQSRSDCRKASQAVIDQAEKCLNLSREKLKK